MTMEATKQKKNQRTDVLLPPARWVCPKCGVRVQTLVPTYVPECRGPKHSRDMVLMVVATSKGDK